MLLRRHGPAGLTQVAAEKGAALARLATETLAGALRMAGTHASPGREVGSRRKLIHVEADFGQQPPGRHAVHAGNRAETRDVILKRAETSIDLLFDGRHLRFGMIEIIE